MRTSGFQVEQRQFALLAVAAGWSVSEVCRAYGITRVTFYRWKAELADGLPLAPSIRAMLAALRAGQPTEAGLRATLRGLGVEPGGARRAPRPQRSPNADGALAERLRQVAEEHPRWGYRRLHALLKAEGLNIGPMQTYRLYQAEGLATRRERAKFHSRGRVGKPGRPTGPNQVWCMTYAEGRLNNGQVFAAWHVYDAFSGERREAEVRPRYQRLLAQRLLKAATARHGAPEQLHIGSLVPVHREIVGWARTQGVTLHVSAELADEVVAWVNHLDCSTPLQVISSL